MQLIERVLMLRENAGRGVEGDPCRWVMVFVRESTLEEICRVDVWEIEQLRLSKEFDSLRSEPAGKETK